MAVRGLELKGFRLGTASKFNTSILAAVWGCDFWGFNRVTSVEELAVSLMGFKVWD